MSWKEWISYGFLFLLFCEEISIFNYQARLLFFLIYVELTTEISYLYIMTEKHCL